MIPRKFDLHHGFISNVQCVRYSTLADVHHTRSEEVKACVVHALTAEIFLIRYSVDNLYFFVSNCQLRSDNARCDMSIRHHEERDRHKRVTFLSHMSASLTWVQHGANCDDTYPDPKLWTLIASIRLPMTFSSMLFKTHVWPLLESPPDGIAQSWYMLLHNIHISISPHLTS